MDFVYERPERDVNNSSKDKQRKGIQKQADGRVLPNESLQKYHPTSEGLRKCLPAHFGQQPIYGQLTLQFEPIIFDSSGPLSKSKHVIYRCQMLGYSKQESPLFTTKITYTIHTNNKMFKLYLKDMKVCVVDVLDQRNYEPVGHFCLNWLTYLRSIDDGQMFSERQNGDVFVSKYEESKNRFMLPFLDENCEATLPVFDYRNPKTYPKSPRHKSPENQKLLFIKPNPHERIIGQVKVKFTSRVYQNPIALGYVQSSQKRAQLHQDKILENRSIRSPGNSSNIYVGNQNKSDSVYRNILLDRRISSNTVNSNFMVQNGSGAYLRRQGSNFSAYHEKSVTEKEERIIVQKDDAQGVNKIKEIGQYQNVNDYNQNERKREKERRIDKKKNFSKSQLQLLQLKLDAQDFFNHKDVQNKIKKEEKLILTILKLKTKLQNINQLDVFISQAGQNEKDLKPSTRVKIYRVQNDKSNGLDYFRSQLIVERPSNKVIEVQLPNNLGKCVFRCKDLSQASNDVCVYNKGVIIGVLTVKRQTDQISITKTGKAIQSLPKKQPQIKNITSKSQEKICVIVVDNFTQIFYKKTEIPEIHQLDNYMLSIRSVIFYHETLNNSKATGEYAIINSTNIPKIFAVEVKNSDNEFVGMSENVCFQGNELILEEKNIMPTLVIEKNVSIQLKQMPIFKRLPNSINFRLSIYVCNTNQLNYFINRWKQNVAKNKAIEARRQKAFSNIKTTGQKQAQRQRQKQYTISDEVSSQKRQEDKRMRTQTINKDSIQLREKRVESKSSDVRESEHSRFQTHGNYTEDLHSRTLVEGRSSPMKLNQEGSFQKQYQDDQQEQQEIYLVQFFCKSLHYVLYRLGSKKNIGERLNQLSGFYEKRDNQLIQGDKNMGNERKEEAKGFVRKDEFERILTFLIGNGVESYQQQLGFDICQILEALFMSQDGQMIKLQEFGLCLMAYYNFLLLLAKEKFTSLRQLIQCEPEGVGKLQRIEQSMTNISGQFLWEDLLPGVLQKTKKSINKRYRVFGNSPFSVGYLLRDLKIVGRGVDNIQDEGLFMSLLGIFGVEDNKRDELFMRVAGDMGSLVRETVEEIVFSQCLRDFPNGVSLGWFVNVESKMQEYALKQNLDSISSNKQDEFGLNLTQFQQFFSSLGIETSIWESLMLIEEIKVWYQVDDFKQKQYSDMGEGVITFELLRLWLKALKIKIQVKTKNSGLGQRIDTKTSRLNSVRSIDQEDEKIIEQMNGKQVTIKNSVENNTMIGDVHKKPPKSPINRVVTKENRSNISDGKKPDPLRRYTERNSLKQSQSMRSINNESDIANIANLLRENENNLYFLPSTMNQPQRMKTAEDRIVSDSDILRGLDYNTLRNEIEALPTRKTVNVPSNRRENGRLQSETQSEDEVEKKKVEKKMKKQQPIDGYVSIFVRDIKLKKVSNAVLKKKGLKRLTLSLKQNSQINESEDEGLSQSKEGSDYYFLTEEVVNRIIQNEPLSNDGQLYSIRNVKIDMGNLYELETVCSQGLMLKLLNLTAAKIGSKEDRQQQLIVSGILPIEDIVGVVEEYKNSIQGGQRVDTEQGYKKRKTMVLYSGRELNGKAVIEVVVSKHIQEEKKETRKYEKLASVEFSFIKKQLSGIGKKASKLQENNKTISKSFKASLSYCSIRDEQNTVQILPKMQQNEVYTLNLPQPIVQYQLVLRSIQPEPQQIPLMESESVYGMTVSRFSQFGKESIQAKQETKQNEEECVIPLETLFYKRTLTSEYPMIDRLTGKFLCSVEVNLKLLEGQDCHDDNLQQSINQSLQ